MKASIQKFKVFIRKNIWADFIFVFIVYISIQLISNYLRSDTKSISELLFSSLCFSLIMVPIFRLLRTNDEGPELYTMVDHVRHYQLGQRSQLKSFLESNGYSLDYNKGSVSYFKSEEESVFSSQRTFIHETDHWIALVAPPNILNLVPPTITSIYPKHHHEKKH